MIHVAAASSKEYLPWCATLFRSCMDHHDPGSLHLHYLDGVGISDQDRQRLEGMIAHTGNLLTIHPIDPGQVAGFPPREPFGGLVVWYRLLLADLLPGLSRVIYLDCDTLVVSSLGPLWEEPLDGAPLGAVANVIEPTMRDYVRSIGVRDPLAVLNSGVLLLDLDRWRAEDALTTLRQTVQSHPADLLWADQDALNLVFDDRWKRLHPRWNAQNSLWTWPIWSTEVHGAARVSEATADPAVVHFEGPHLCKPWHYLCDQPWRGAYLDTRARTPWGPADFVDRTMATRAIKLLPRGRRPTAYMRLLSFRARDAAARR